jgi:hypothetical protein
MEASTVLKITIEILQTVQSAIASAGAYSKLTETLRINNPSFQSAMQDIGVTVVSVESNIAGFNANQKQENNSSSFYIIIGAAAGGGGLLLIIAGICIYCCCCKHKKNSKQQVAIANTTIGYDGVKATSKIELPIVPGQSVNCTDRVSDEPGACVHEQLEGLSSHTVEIHIPEQSQYNTNNVN